MNNSYELNYAFMSKEQVDQFAYNITAESISNYFLEHQEEYHVWLNIQGIKQLIKQTLKIQANANLQERRNLLMQLRKEQIK